MLASFTRLLDNNEIKVQLWDCVFPIRKLSGFDLWLEANRNSIRADYPDLSEDDVGQQAEIFRSLTEEERQVRALSCSAHLVKRIIKDCQKT